MSLYNGPPRPGARGGRDQFSWDNVKADKDREYYLGHSVKALAGRWQKGRDVYWYTREKAGQDTLQDEVHAVKQREEELMMEALGLKPKTVVKPAPQLDKHDLDDLIKGKKDEQELADEAGAAAQEADRIKGLGYIAGTGGGPAEAEAVHTTLPAVGAAGPGPHGQRFPPPPPMAAAAPAGGRPGAAVALASGMTAAQLKELRKAEKRARKEAKKEAKKAKKEAKRAKKEAKKARREGEGAKLQHAGDRKTRRRRAASGSSSSSSSSDESSSDSDGDRRQPHGRSPEAGGTAAGRHRAGAMRPEGPSDRAPPQVAWGPERDRRPELDRDRSWERDRGRDKDMERERGLSGPAHGREEPPRGAGRQGNDAGDDYGRQPRARARHDSPSRSPRPRRGANPVPVGQQPEQQRWKRRHDSPSPRREGRQSRSRSRSPPERRWPEPLAGTRVGDAAWRRRGPYEEDAPRGDPRAGGDRSGGGGGSAAGRAWGEDRHGYGDRAHNPSRSPRGRRHDSRSPGPRRRERRSDSPGDRRGARGDNGRGGAAATGGAHREEGAAAVRDRQRERRNDSRSRSPDRGRIRGR